MTKNKLRITLPMILLVLWMWLILYFSTDTAIQSNSKSVFIEQIVGPIIQKISIILRGHEISSANMQFIVRKMAHMFNFGVLSFLSYLSCYSIKPRKFLSSLFAIVFSTTFALVDEFYQTFIPGRSGSVRDVLIDSIGIYAAVFFLAIVMNIYEKWIRKRKSL